MPLDPFRKRKGETPGTVRDSMILRRGLGGNDKIPTACDPAKAKQQTTERERTTFDRCHAWSVKGDRIPPFPIPAARAVGLFKERNLRWPCR
jgi:hypothetical protein